MDIYEYIYLGLYVFRNICVCICVCMYMYVCICVCICVCVYVCVVCVYTYVVFIRLTLVAVSVRNSKTLRHSLNPKLTDCARLMTSQFQKSSCLHLPLPPLFQLQVLMGLHWLLYRRGHFFSHKFGCNWSQDNDDLPLLPPLRSLLPMPGLKPRNYSSV